ncbi:Vps51/Vps67-domain-containing protein [Podospora didyma]|uniref:Vacuolar protein sorting-associated protein 51 homolog n=1 Tax=Podospora didyma TaxID=330526 RepID=A0AAE0TZE0_9PEZI|nr:Vps51/Vps67-domain-containing protein [Podospora didyma]
MSTIASPRDMPRRMNSSHAANITPTSSSRPSLDLPASTLGSPNPNAGTSSAAGAPAPNNKRATRAALREYYNIRNKPPSSGSGASTPTVEVTDAAAGPDFFSSLNNNNSGEMMTAPSELDAPNFSAETYIASILKKSSMTDLLRTYARVLGEIRALDAEKKALVYDNYSKLISATETIRRMRSTMDPLNPMASTLDLVVAKIYEQASGMREELRREVPRPTTALKIAPDTRERTKQLVQQVLAVPERLRRLMQEGKEDEARREWEMPRRLLERWKERGLGGDDVGALLEEGDAIVARGGESLEQSASTGTT